MSDESLPQILQQHWIHSHEEDTASEMVFRPASFQFPPSRGRAGFELMPGGVATDYGIAAADGWQESASSWSLDEHGNLTIADPTNPRRRRVLHIAQATKDRLTVRK